MNRIKLSRNFSLHEFESPDTKEVIVYKDLIIKLQQARDIVKNPLIITSGYRTEKHNFQVGGKKKSQHRIGAAVDISLFNHVGKVLRKIFIQVGFRQVILYDKRHFIHVALYKKNPLM